MNPNKILSSPLLDIIFDDRNKEYGAYELRKTYSRRIKRALAITIVMFSLLIIGTSWANSKKTVDRPRYKIDEQVITEIKPDEKELEPPPPIERTPPPQVETIVFTPPVIRDDELIQDPPPQIDDLEDVRISDADKPGIKDLGIPEGPEVIDDNKQIIEQRTKEPEDYIYPNVQVQASFPGGENKWRQYLENNCNGQVAYDNGAPEGKYTTMVQFVVDKDGTISNVQALTNHGYGMEAEAMRVILKGPKWNPAINQGIPVKAYRKQPITFMVAGE
jgi:periplasmic protein TonB